MLRLRRVFVVSTVLTLSGVALGACEGEDGVAKKPPPPIDGGTDGGSDASTTEGGGETGTDTGPPDAGLYGCQNNFTDRTAASASRTVPWDFDVPTKAERCMMIKKGQEVTWLGNFTTHPIQKAAGGDEPNPITGSPTATFTATGNFLFECVEHPTFMIGVIKVVE